VPDRESGRTNGVTSSRRGLASRVNQALDASLRASIGPGRFGLDGRLREWRDALVPGLDQSLLSQCAGSDLSRLRQPESSAALAINSFLNWTRCPGQLQLAGHKGFRELRFEARCPTGVRGTPPQLDFIALGDDTVVAVATRCLEYLGRRHGKLSAGYDRLQPASGLEPWTELVARWRREPRAFHHVDLPALIKHALGLGRTFPNRTIRLHYLFWEPLGADEADPFRRHRLELDRLAQEVASSSVALTAQTFHDLWQGWEERGHPDWLRGIVARLRSRYDVAMADITRL
jgi:hypothetical protein